MKKGCLIGIGILVAIIALVSVAAIVAYAMLDRRVGLTMAEEKPWQDFVPTGRETAVLFEVYPSSIAEKLAPAIDKVPLPAVLKLFGAGSGGMAIRNLMPHKVVGGLNLRPDLSAADLNLFVNERQFGILMAEMLTYDFLARTLPQVKWNAEGAVLHERGALTLSGTLPILPSAEDVIQQIGGSQGDASPIKLEESHDIEVAVDNSGGQIIAIAGIIAALQNMEIKEVLGGNMGDMVLRVLGGVHNIRLTGRIKDADTATVKLLASATPESGGMLNFVVTGFWPWVVENGRSRFGLTIQGEPVWDPARNLLEADLTVTGIEGLVVSRLTAMVQGGR